MKKEKIVNVGIRMKPVLFGILCVVALALNPENIVKKAKELTSGKTIVSVKEAGYLKSEADGKSSCNIWWVECGIFEKECKGGNNIAILE